ncbi:MAG: glutamate--tRNA ligase [Candidatus Hodgkinia cicadicola]
MRVRIAPSPTGELHLGNLFVFIWNFILKLKYKSSFILRLEDTDSSKINKNYILSIYNTLDILNINIDESPKLLGLYGPYKQSERKHIYNFYRKLLEKRKMCFWCNCSFRRINALKRINLSLGETNIYDGKCISSRNKTGKLRLKVPRYGTFIDNYKMHWSQVDMQILWINDRATFNLANVIDDYLMKITHIFRGRDWLLSLPKHILINTYLNFSIPKYYHLPLICTNKRTKLSKRFMSLGLNGMLNLGIIPQAIMKYLMSIIGNFPNNTLKLKQTNIQVDFNQIIRTNRLVISNLEMESNMLSKILKEIKLKTAIKYCAQKSAVLYDIYRLMSFVFWKKKINTDKFINLYYILLKMLLLEYKQVLFWTKNNIRQVSIKLSKYLGLKLRTFSIIASTLILGSRDSISLYDGCVVLGREIIIARISILLEEISCRN